MTTYTKSGRLALDAVLVTALDFADHHHNPGRPPLVDKTRLHRIASFIAMLRVAKHDDVQFHPRPSVLPLHTNPGESFHGQFRFLRISRHETWM